MKISVVIASTGRPELLAKWAIHYDRQTLRPDQFIYSVVKRQDLPSDEFMVPDSIFVFGSAGSCAQRNRGLEVCLSDCDLVCFFDDDYVPTKTCFEGIAEFFLKNPTISGANGTIIADGINSQGLDYETAIKKITYYEQHHNSTIEVVKYLSGLYGCNMVFRKISIGSVRFDENLPLYGWQEDIDFAARISKNGMLVKTNAFAGVHLGTKTARTSGVKFGYSQIANPLYLVEKGTMNRGYALKILLKNLAMNHLKFFFPERWVDRRGRVRGNWIAIYDLIRNRIQPSNILNIK